MGQLPYFKGLCDRESENQDPSLKNALPLSPSEEKPKFYRRCSSQFEESNGPTWTNGLVILYLCRTRHG